MLVLMRTQFRLALPARVVVLLAIALPVGAQASQNGDRANWPSRVNTLPLTASPGADSLRAEVAPSMGASSPTAFGLRFGEVYLAASVQSRVRYADVPDGAISAGLGLGDPAKLLGLQIDINSFSTLASAGSSAGLGGVVGVDVKLHRLLPYGFGLALGWESLLSKGSGEVATDGGSNRYGVVSKWTPLRASGPFRDLVISVGVGSGRFLREHRWAEDADQFGPFGSAALRVFRSASIVADWTGQDLLLGASLAPFVRVPLVLNAGIADVMGTTNGSQRGRLVASASVAYDYLRPRSRTAALPMTQN